MELADVSLILRLTALLLLHLLALFIGLNIELQLPYRPIHFASANSRQKLLFLNDVVVLIHCPIVL
jgi:hypothetical protein